MQKGFVPVLILIIVATLGVIGYLSYKSYLPKPNTQVVSYSPSPTSLKVSEKGEATKPKNYSNEKYGFSFEYPSQAKITTRDPDPLPVVVQVQDLQPRTSGGGGPEVTGWFITFSEIQTNPKNLTLTEWAKQNGLTSESGVGGGYQTPITSLKIAGHEAIYWETTGGDVHLAFYLVKRSTGVQLLMINAREEDWKTINQILASIKFTEDKSVWKIYTNTKYKFTFNHPFNYEILDNGMNTPDIKTASAIVTIADNSSAKLGEEEPRLSVTILELGDKTLEQRANMHFEKWGTYSYQTQYPGVVNNSVVDPIKKTNFLGQTAFTYEIAGSWFDDGAVEGFAKNRKIKYIWLSKDGIIYLIRADSEYPATQMLSTFKFTQ